MGKQYDSDEAEAIDQVMEDSEEISNWLAGECTSKHGCAWPVQRDVTAEDFTGEETHKLLALLFDVGQPASVTVAARDALRTQYLRQSETRDLVSFATLRISYSRDRDEAETLAEHNAQFKRVMDYDAPHHSEVAA